VILPWLSPAPKIKLLISRFSLSRLTAVESGIGISITITVKFFVVLSAPFDIVAVRVTVAFPDSYSGLVTIPSSPENEIALLSLSHVMDVPLDPFIGTEKFCVRLFVLSPVLRVKLLLLIAIVSRPTDSASVIGALITFIENDFVSLSVPLDIVAVTVKEIFPVR